MCDVHDGPDIQLFQSWVCIPQCIFETSYRNSIHPVDSHKPKHHLAYFQRFTDDPMHDICFHTAVRIFGSLFVSRLLCRILRLQWLWAFLLQLHIAYDRYKLPGYHAITLLQKHLVHTLLPSVRLNWRVYSSTNGSCCSFWQLQKENRTEIGWKDRQS